MAMTDRQVAFFRALLEPFPQTAYKNVRGYTYIKARTIKNRLDDIVGPTGWAAEYTSTERGYKCRLKIFCPDHTPDGWVWHYKEDGGGREDMGQKDKQTGEWDVDQDNDEKAAYTNAFRRAAGEWGFGRELYKEGVPRWLADLYPDAGVCTPKDEPPPIRGSGDGRNGSHDSGGLEEPRRSPGPPSPPTPSNGHNGQRKANLTPPTRASGVFPWIMGLQEHFGIEIKKAVSAHCEKTYGSWDTRQLSEAQVKELTTWVVKKLKAGGNYAGECDVDEPEDYVPDGPPVAKPAPPSASAGSELGNVKRAIISAVQATIRKQTGHDATVEEQLAMIGEIAANCKNAHGHTGEVLDSLRDCHDKVWLMNIKTEANKQMLLAAQYVTPKPEPVPVAGDADYDDLGDIPF